MIAHVFKPRRRNKAGRTEAGRIYRGRFRLKGEFSITEVSLETSDKQVAEKKLAELISEKERERAGLVAPKLERESAQKPLAKHLDDFAADLNAIGRTQKYSLLLKARVQRLLADCAWKHPADISMDGFISWRAKQKKFGPKTLNEYLNAISGLLNWMTKQGRIAENPLKNVSHVDLRGRQLKRRAFSDEELDRLLAVAKPDLRLLYLAAAFTGLRVGELQEVRWDDVLLDHERPHIVVRAITAKNRKDAIVPLHPQLLQELRKLKTPKTRPVETVFSQHPHPDRRIRADMIAAGIARIDEMGRKLDCHALRYTFATKLACSGVSQRLAQELLRHSDPRLTANIYTDVTRLPTFAAVTGLPWQADGKDMAAKKSGGPAELNSQLAPQTLVPGGPNGSQVGATKSAPTFSKDVDYETDSLEMAHADTNCQMVEVAGFEPACP